MSIRQSTSTSHEYPCERDGCTETFEHGDDVAGSFCSEECHHKHRGKNLLTYLENDHCTCANCGSILKTIEKPKPERAFDHTGDGWTYDHDEERWRIQWYGQVISHESAVGFQHRTTEAEIGEKGDHTGAICGNCGNCTLSKPFPEVQRRFQLEYASGILDTIRKKRDEGTHDKEIDGHEFFHTLIETRDIPLSLGKAIEE